MTDQSDGSKSVGDNQYGEEENDKTISTFECPICLRLLVEPVTTACGHTFCKNCITKTMDHRQLCPSCRAPCPFIGSTNVMVANLIQQRYPEEYALRSKEVKELEEEEKAQSDTSDGTALGVFFPFLRLPHENVPFPYGNRQAFQVLDEEVNAARAIWRGGAARSVVVQMEEDGASVGPAVLGEISQVRGNRIWFIGRGRVEGLNGGTYTNTSGFEVRKYSTNAIRDNVDDDQREDIIGVAESCLTMLYDDRLPRLGQMGVNKFNHLHDNRSRPTRGQLNAMDSLQLEKLSFWLCSCLKAPLSLRVGWLRTRDTMGRLQSIRDYMGNAGANQIINLEEDAAGGSVGSLRGISWSLILLLAIFLALFLKYSGVLDVQYGEYLIG